MTRDDRVFLVLSLMLAFGVGAIIVSIYLTHWWWLAPIFGGLVLILIYQALYGGGE